MLYWFGQTIGFAAIGLSATIYIHKRSKKIIIVKLLTDLLWAIHHLLTGNISAAATTFVSIFREILLLKSKSVILLFVFPVLFFSTLLFTYSDITSILPPLASSIVTVGLWNKNVKVMKRFAVLQSMLMLIYGIFNSSYATMFNETIILGSIFLTNIRQYLILNSHLLRNNTEMRHIMEEYSYKGNDFKTVLKTKKWKIGLLRYSERFSSLGVWERHLKTDEVFVLLSGTAILYTKDTDGVIEKKEMKVGTVYNLPAMEWHHIVVSRDATVMVVENSDTSKVNTEKVTI